MMLMRLNTGLVILCFALALSAQEPGDHAGDGGHHPRPEKRHDKNSWQNRRDQLKKHIDVALETVKKDDPERYEELIKLRETDRRRFMVEMRPLLRKQPGDDQHGPRHDQGRHRGKRFGERFLEHLKQQDPERFEKLQKLRRDNPAEFRKEMDEIFSSFRQKHFKRDERIDKLVAAYRKAEDEAEKSRVQEALRKVVAEGFEKRMAIKEKELESFKKRIEQMENALESYRKSKDTICEKRVAELLDPSVPGRQHGPDKQRPAPRHPPTPSP